MPQTEAILDLFEHPTRREAFEAVSERPGVHFQALADAVDVPKGTLEYHLRVLVDEGLLLSERHGKYKCLFPDDSRHGERDRERLAALSAPTTGEIAAYLREEPSAYQVVIADELDIALSTVRHHLDRLREAGIVEEVREGNCVRYRLQLEPHEVERLPDVPT